GKSDRTLEIGGLGPRKLLMPPGELQLAAFQLQAPLPVLRPRCGTFRLEAHLQGLAQRAGRAQAAFEFVAAAVGSRAQALDVELPFLDAARWAAVMKTAVDYGHASVAQRTIQPLAPFQPRTLAARQGVTGEEELSVLALQRQGGLVHAHVAGADEVVLEEIQRAEADLQAGRAADRTAVLRGEQLHVLEDQLRAPGPAQVDLPDTRRHAPHAPGELLGIFAERRHLRDGHAKQSDADGKQDQDRSAKRGDPFPQAANNAGHQNPVPAPAKDYRPIRPRSRGREGKSCGSGILARTSSSLFRGGVPVEGEGRRSRL